MLSEERFKLCGLGVFALGYFGFYEVVLIPLLESPIDPQDGGPICVFVLTLMNIAYRPGIILGELLSYAPVPLFVDGPNQPGMWVIVILFGLGWGFLLTTVGGAVRKVINKVLSAELRT